MVKRRFRVVLDGEVYDVEVEVEEGLSELETLLKSLETGVIKRVEMTGGRGVGKMYGSLPAPISGRVTEVRVNKGDHVMQGDLLLVMEAMKTRVEIKSPREGLVREVYVKPGQSVRQGDPLLAIF